MSDITMENGGAIFKVSPWTQYFDLKGQEPPRALVRNVKISNIRGTGASFGEITGHPEAEIKDIYIKNADIALKSPYFKLGDVKGLRFKNVKVNGVKMSAPVANTQAAK